MKCIETYDGKEFWINEEDAVKLQKALELLNPPKFVKVNGATLNTSNISGVFTEQDMQEKEYRKRGMYICEFNRWHEFKEVCKCRVNKNMYGEYGSAPLSKRATIANLDIKTINDGNIG